MKTKTVSKSVLILIVIGTLVSAQQVSAESVFTPRGIDAAAVPAAGNAVAAGVASSASDQGGLGFRALPEDTVETFEVQIEEEKGPGIGKQLAVFAIITAVVGYAVISLMSSDDEPATSSTTTGKQPPYLPPGAAVPMMITR
jgi:hypothetical protein